jgi:diguanylate cyclase (GGDEF)-like protein/PAS domain S-box-containing protein
LPDATVGLDEHGVLEWANEAAVRLFGWSAEDYVGRQVFELVHPADLDFVVLSFASVQAKEVGTYIEVRVKTATGWKLLEVIGANRLGQAGLDCLVFSFRDLTERRRWEVGRDNDAMFRAVVHNAASLLILCDAKGTIDAVSGAVARLLGLDPENLEGALLTELVRPQDKATVQMALQACQQLPPGWLEPVTVEVDLVSGDDRAVPFELTLVNLVGEPTTSGIVVTGHNITKLRGFQQALADLALKDPLTMLANRTVVDERLERELSLGQSVSVAFVDLDGFKTLNDSFGHHVGDLVLKEVADRLAAAVRHPDLVARYGGDEFVVIAAGELRPDIRHLCDRLSSAVSQPIRIADRLIGINATIGIAHSRPGDTPIDVLDRADRAMYASKTAQPRPSHQSQEIHI